jgi:glycosyltransferase involved in cell wall biosynthesis
MLKKKLKIIHIITGLSTGGAEMMLYKLLSVTDRNIFNPIVISLTDCGPIGSLIKALEVPVYNIEISKNLLLPIRLCRFIKLVSKLQPNLIQGWMYHANLATLLASWFIPYKIPVLWNIRHTPCELKDEKKLTAFLIRLSTFFSSRPTKIIYNSHVSAYQHKLLGFSDKHQEVIPNGFDCNYFKPSEDARLKLRNYLGFNHKTFLIGLIARYHPMKGHMTFIRAAGRLVAQYPDVHFILAGRGIDETNSILTKIIQEVNIMRNIHLLGECSNMSEIIATLDISTNTSAWGESFPNVVGESMACGIPCVVTDIGDSAWIVGDTGIVIQIKNIDELVKAWIKLIKIGSEGRKKLGKKARERIMNNFSLSKIINDYEETYREILNINK